VKTGLTLLYSVPFIVVSLKFDEASPVTAVVGSKCKSPAF
jgi:hypothetical protein